MAKHRCHSIEFNDISRNLTCEAGAFDEDVRAADLLQEYEAKIAALKHLVGRQALEVEFSKGGHRRTHCGREARGRP